MTGAAKEYVGERDCGLEGVEDGRYDGDTVGFVDGIPVSIRGQQR